MRTARPGPRVGNCLPFLIWLALLPVEAAGPGQKAGPLEFDFGGQLRLRHESAGGFTLKGYEPGDSDQLLLERVRLDFSLRLWDQPRIFLQIQDAHPFLTKLKDKDFPRSSPIEDTFDIRQFHAEWLKIGGTPFGFRVGRQQIAYGDQRVFGPGNWGNTGRFAWDAVMFKVQTDRFDSDLWGGKYLTYKSGVWPNRSARDFFTFVSYTQVKRLPFRLDLFYVFKKDSSGAAAGETGPGGVRAHTLGFQAEGRTLEVLDASATYARQTGRWAGDRLRAGGASGKLGVTFPAAWKPRLGGQYTWGSGDSDPADGVHGTFDGVYGGRDIFFYGYLNLFAWANLRDAQLDFSFRPRDSLTGYVELHHFRLDQPSDAWYTTGIRPYRRDPSGRSGVTLGREVDLRLVWTRGKHLELMGGGGRLYPGAFLRNTGPAGPANWIFTQAAYSW